MYCKKCGRKLKDGMRYCDRCGQSVRQNQNIGRDARRKEIEDLKKERLNRKQKLHEKEIKKKQNKQINKKRTNILAVIFVILFCILLIAVITFNVMNNNSKGALWRTQDGSVEMNSTPIPSATPVPTDSTGAKITPAPTATAYALTGEINTDGYREYKCSYDITFCYPGTFIQQPSTNNAKINLYDKSGGASITLTEEPTSAQAKDLMMEYAKSIPVKASTSRAGDGWYMLEYTENDIIYHRKCLIVNNTAIYYDFSYSKSSTAASTYARQVIYMDEHFSS